MRHFIHGITQTGKKKKITIIFISQSNTEDTSEKALIQTAQQGFSSLSLWLT